MNWRRRTISPPHTAHLNPVFGSMRLKHYYKDFIKQAWKDGLSQSTIHGLEMYLYGSLSHSIQDIDPLKLTIRHYHKALEAGKKHGKWGEFQTAKVFKKFLHYLEKIGLRPTIDWRDLKSPKAPKKKVEYLTKEDVEKIRAFFPETIEGIRTRAMFEIGLSTGMRIGEICSLDKKDLDFTNNTVCVTNIKTGAVDVLSFTKRAEAAVKKYVSLRHDDEDALFYAQNNGRLKTVTARYWLTVYEKELNLGKPIYWHLLRKSFISHLVFGGMDIREVQSKARHSDPSITLRHYTALRDDHATKRQLEIMEEI